MNQENSEILFSEISKRIFREEKGKIYIGNDEIKPDLYDILKEQARYLKSSQLYEIFKSTIIDESSKLALLQSSNFEQVQFAKALYHLMFVLDSIMAKLSKKDLT